MFAVHYEITLPADYDMGIVRSRVESRGQVTDDWPDLGFKAYLARFAGRDGSPVNQYAPFYLWNDTPGFHRFMLDGGFSNIVRDFGRPAAQHWTGLAFDRGPAYGQTPSWATRVRTTIPDDLDPAVAIAHAIGEAGAESLGGDVHSTALAVDTRHWELVRLTLWHGQPAPEQPGVHFQVLHLSSPGLDAIPTGRHW